MDITIGTSELASELAMMEKAINRRATVAVLGGVLIQAGLDSVRLSGTDTEIALTSVCQAKVSKPGEAVVHAQKLHELVRSLPRGEVRLELDSSGLRLTAGSFKGRLAVFPAADFPSLPDLPSGAIVPIGRVALKEIIRRTRYAVSETDKRFFMAGTLLEPGDGVVRMVGTDGHRLALADAKSTGTTKIAGAIIPRKTLETLATVLDSGPDTVDFAVGDNHIFFIAGDRVLVSRKVDGKFAEYLRVIPQAYPNALVAQAEDMASAMRRAALLAHSATRLVSTTLTPGALDIVAESADVGSGEESVTASYEGPTIRVGLNVTYLLDFLDAVGKGPVRMEAKDEESSVRLSASDDQVNYLYVQMPVRLK